MAADASRGLAATALIAGCITHPRPSTTQGCSPCVLPSSAALARHRQRSSYCSCLTLRSCIHHHRHAGTATPRGADGAQKKRRFEEELEALTGALTGGRGGAGAGGAPAPTIAIPPVRELTGAELVARRVAATVWRKAVAQQVRRDGTLYACMAERGS